MKGASQVVSRDGFTLLEVLISITLIAVLVVILSMALRSGINAYVRARGHNETLFPVSALEGMIFRQLEAIVSPGDQGFKEFVYFKGKRRLLAFTTTYGPQGLGKGGFFKVVYGFSPEDNTLYYAQKIIVRPSQAEAEIPDRFFEQDLDTLKKSGWFIDSLPGVKDFAFAYAQGRDNKTDPADWSEVFLGKGQLPLEVAFKLDLSRGKGDTVTGVGWIIVPVGVL